MKKLLYIVILLVLVTACGRGTNENYEDTATEEYNIIIPVEPVETASIERTLTIRTNNNFKAVIEQARDMLNASWQERGYNYELSIEFDLVEDFDSDFNAVLAASEAYGARLRVELMGGRGPDLIFNEHPHITPVFDFAQTGFLMDFYTLIDNCDFLSRDDFFMELLRANEFRGGLYEMPVMFGFHYIGINNNLPEYIIERFTQFSYIGASTLLELYLDFLDNHDFLYLGTSHPLNVLTLNIMEFIDFNTNTFDFNRSGFIDSFLLSRRVDISRMVWPDIVTLFRHPFGDVGHISTEQMFHSSSMALGSIDAFMDRGLGFSHFIPVANDHGSLVVRFGDAVTRGTPLIWMPAAGDTALAWDLVRYLIVAFAEPVGRAAQSGRIAAPWGNNSFTVPIMRSLFESNIQAIFDGIARIGISHFIPEVTDIIVQNAIDKLYRHANMPMVIPNPHLPMHLVRAPLNDFVLGLISEQEAVSRAQNALTLWFMEF